MVISQLKGNNVMDFISIADIPSDDNYDLLYSALVSRIEHPEIDLDKSILYLIQQLKKQRTRQHSTESDFIDILIEYEKYVGYDIVDTTVLIGCYLMFANLRKEG